MRKCKHFVRIGAKLHRLKGGLPLRFSPDIWELVWKIVLLLCRRYGFDDPTADLDESECNRNENGEFAEKPGGAASESQRAETQTSKKASESSIKGKPESVEIPEKERAALQEKILNGIIEEEISVHAEKRMLERNVETPQVIDAVKNPLRVFKGSADAKGRPSVKFIGNEATACFNPDSGILTSAWPTNHKLRKKYGGD